MRLLAILFWFLLGLIVAAAAAIGWYFSDSILKPQPYTLLEEFEIIAVAEGQVTLPEPPNDAQFANTRREGVFNLLWHDGYGRLGDVVAEADGSLTRELTNIIGAPPSAGDKAQLEAFIFRQNPLEDHGIAYEALFLNGEEGKLRSWWIPQHEEIAVLMLHGRRRGRIAETLRILPALVAEGYSVLSLSYRNHSDSDPSRDGFYHYGETEWKDVVVGLEFLKEQGIERVVLYGFSMGGAVALETLENYPESAIAVDALIMDAPLLDPRTIFRLGASNMGLPLANRLADLALFVAGLRAGIDWQGLDQRNFASSVDVPTLLITGVEDSTIPLKLVDDFAANVPDIEYHRVENADHVESWNENPEVYETWIKTFLASHAPL